jgi:hypothetical protein
MKSIYTGIADSFGNDDQPIDDRTHLQPYPAGEEYKPTPEPDLVKYYEYMKRKRMGNRT